MAVALLLFGCETPPPLTATVDVSATQSASAGGRAQLVVAVTNTGPAIPHVGLVFMSDDKWYDHHDVTDASGCTVDRDRSAFDCGDLAPGASATFSIAGIAQQAGSFHYKLALRQLVRPFHYVNDHPDGADAHEWNEVVTGT